MQVRCRGDIEEPALKSLQYFPTNTNTNHTRRIAAQNTRNVWVFWSTNTGVPLHSSALLYYFAFPRAKQRARQPGSVWLLVVWLLSSL